MLCLPGSMKLISIFLAQPIALDNESLIRA